MTKTFYKYENALQFAVDMHNEGYSVSIDDSGLLRNWVVKYEKDEIPQEKPYTVRHFGAETIWGVPEGLNEGEYVIRFSPDSCAHVRTDKGYAPLFRKEKGRWELGLVTQKAFNGLDRDGKVVMRMTLDNGKCSVHGCFDNIIKIVEDK